jgi:23S rRNA pseudouridine1911/1915/1917 synthase
MDTHRRTAVVEPHEDGSTLAAVLRGVFPGVSWNKVRDLVRTGRVRVDEVVEYDPALRVREGATIEVDPQARKRPVPVLEPDQIVYVDHDVIVVRKPPGIVVAPHEEGDGPVRPDVDSLLARTRATLREQAERSGRTARDGLGVVQRLDKDTTGILVFARTHQARKALQDQLRAHKVLRRYLALTHGVPDDETIESWLVPDRGDGRRGSWHGEIGRPPKIAKKAITHVHVVRDLGKAALVECRLETGRQHQVRIHLAERGHPLIGDETYLKGYRGMRIPANRPMLHAASLGFRHPSERRWVQFEDPPPTDFAAMLAALQREQD